VVEGLQLSGILWVCGEGARGNKELHGFGEFSLFDKFHDPFPRLFGGGCGGRVFVIGIGSVVEEVPFAFPVVLEAIPNKLGLCLLGVFGKLVGSRKYDSVEVDEEFPKTWCIWVVMLLFVCR
jgi:hypothetical protein